MKKIKIPLSRPSLGQDELEAVGRVFKSGWLGMGKEVFHFENSLRKFFKRKYVLAVSTGTNALHIALDSIGLGRGDEVIVPSLTFVGSVMPILLCGAKPIFCDVERGTINTSKRSIEEKITKKTKAAIIVHYGGLPCDMDEILKLGKTHHIRIIEDAAHAFGSYYKNRLIGSFGDISCFSFDPIKSITCGEGGAVVLDDKKTRDVIIKKRILGIDKDTWNRYKHKRSWFYEVGLEGYRYHMSNINAAIGLAQLRKMNFFIKKRQCLARLYDKGLKGINGIETINRDYTEIVPFNYTVLAEERDKLMNHLQNFGITTGINYIPNHIQPIFKARKARLLNTEYLYRKILSLPLYAGMRNSEVDYTLVKIRKFYK